MSQPKITLITITRNEASALVHAISSVEAQTYRDVEHIVVDGNSTDHTLDVLAEYPSVRVIEDNGHGLWHALNMGLEAAQGDVIGMVHGNDRLASPDVLAEVARIFELDPTVEFIYGDVVYRAPNPGARITRTYSARRFTPDKLKYGFTPPHPSLYMRRELVQAVGPYSEDYVIGADFDYWLRLFASGAKGRYLPMVMVEMSPGGISSRLSNRLRYNFKEKWKALGRNGYPRRPLWLLRRLLFFFD